MPSPIAHSIVSLTLSPKKPSEIKGMKWVLFWIILGNFADFDFIPGIVIGDPSRFHHGPSHSILCALVLAILAYRFYPVLFHGHKAPFWAMMSVTFSHLFLDMLTVDRVPPCGLPLLWPFSSYYFLFPFSLFLNMNRGMTLHILFSLHNLIALAIEVILTLPFLVWVVVKRRRAKFQLFRVKDKRQRV